MNLDYLTSNALNKYPFADNASLKSNEGAFISNDTFLDVVFVAKEATITQAWLKAFACLIDASQFVLTFGYRDEEENDLGEIDMAIPFGSIANKEMYSIANDRIAVKVVFGLGFIRAMTATSVTLLFTYANAHLAPSAIIRMVPRVKSVAFYNWDKNTNLASVSPLTTVEGDEYSDIDLILESGANVSMGQIGNQATINVTRGAGTGLYDGCVSQGLVIKKINSTGPDANFNFLMVTDDCYTTTPLEHSLAFENICTPKCTREQIVGYAYYLNRINDGMEWVRDYAYSVANTIKAEVDHYNNVVVPLKNQPSYKVKFEKFPTIDEDRFYYSFAAGFFNPTGDDLVVDITFTTTTGVIVHNSRRFRVGNDTTILSADVVTGTVPCLKVGIVEFVVSTDEAATVSISGTFGSLAINYDVNIS